MPDENPPRSDVTNGYGTWSTMDDGTKVAIYRNGNRWQFAVKGSAVSREAAQAAVDATVAAAKG